MRETFLLIAALVTSFCGMGWLALAMKAHWQQVRGDAAISSGSVRMLRIVGVVALIISMFLCALANHPSIAVLVWVMSLAAAALLVAFALSWSARSLSWLVVWIRD